MESGESGGCEEMNAASNEKGNGADEKKMRCHQHR